MFNVINFINDYITKYGLQSYTFWIYAIIAFYVLYTMRGVFSFFTQAPILILLSVFIAYWFSRQQLVVGKQTVGGDA